MDKLDGKIVLVTGAAQGLGKAICDTLADNGVQIVATDKDKEKLERTVSEITAKGNAAVGYQINVSDPSSIKEVVKQTLEKFGKIDVLVNNAGVDVTKPIDELSIDEWDLVLDVNLSGPFLMTKEIYPKMLKGKKGHIINIVSTAAKRSWPNASAYHASKWGLLGFSHALHSEARQQNIKVTAVVAGGMRTSFILDRFPNTDPKTLQDPKNVAETIKFILSQPPETVISEVMVLPMKETSWP